MKLTEKFKNEMKKDKAGGLNTNEIKMEKTISKEIESNTCGICYELMLPPTHSPILLFPCGHTFCNLCTKDHTKRSGAKCPFCRKIICSQAPNLSLQNLICTFTNNKHLLDQVKDEDLYPQETKANNPPQEEATIQNYLNELQICEMRYKVIKSEKREIQESFIQLEKVQLTKKEVLKELEKNKASAMKKLEKLKAEIALIDDFMEKTYKEEISLEKEIETTQTKLELINGTLEPIEKEKTKYEMFIRALTDKNRTGYKR